MFRKWRPGGFLSFLFTKKKMLILDGIICKTQTNSAFSLESQQFRKRQEKWQADWQADDD